MKFGKIIVSIIGKLFGVLNTVYYRLKFKLLRKRVIWGKGVSVYGKLVISGPGLVQFGNQVHIYGRGHPVTPFTHDKDAVIKIGDHTFLNGTRFGCASRIVIGSHCLIGDARIMDTDFHPVDPDQRKSGKESGETGDVEIGNNVWIGAGVFVLRNTMIGSDSTVGAAAVVKGEFPERVLIAGNPARIVKRF